MTAAAFQSLSSPSTLLDAFGRRIDYLRVSVTDRCDLRCSYCLPKGFNDFVEPLEWLTFDEITRVVAAFVRLGTRRVRLTGGEPLLRRNLHQLASQLSALEGLSDLSLTTNGTQLDRHAVQLYASGIKRLNVSLDSLDPDCVKRITGRDCLEDVLQGLQAAQEAGFHPIKLNMVVMPGINEADIERMAAFAIERGFHLRLIETMPMGDTGRQTSTVALDAIRRHLAEQFKLTPSANELGGGPARYWQSEDGLASIGFITPISQHFCATCNRVRLSADGTLYLCLGQEDKLELRPLLRAGASDTDLENAIRGAILLKPERHEFTEQPAKLVRFMSMTGG
ncbi:GTP 3',8-cyclase MoaA [Burkholderiaceae bacterium DAT-1]|nr:GTP 3',8-cyclase MoaA [Burkholderiaceae bacterium DAT-1]